MLEEKSLNWALKHLKKYYSSDFFPKAFEYNAIEYDWDNVRTYILSIDLNKYIPNSPIIGLAKKTDGNYRIVHDLSPIDAIIYTGLIYEVAETIEGYRIPETEKIACSYRILPDLNGSFFKTEDNGWSNFKEKEKEHLTRFKDGYILYCDIADFYNQIYIHRIRNVLADAGSGLLDDHAKVIENFLLDLNTNSSKGIPVGPAASIILAELILGDIDRKILTMTREFVRWVDDIFIFGNSPDELEHVLYELTKYLHITHRLIFNSSKTKIISVKDYLTNVYEDEVESERKHLENKKNDVIKKELQSLFFPSHYYAELYNSEFSKEEIDGQINDVIKSENFNILSNAYYEALEKCIHDKSNFRLAKHIIKQSAKYRVRKILPLVLENFELLLPNIREVIVYLRTIINETSFEANKTQIEHILMSHYVKNPFVNTWLVYLLLNPKLSFVELPPIFKENMSIRDKILLYMSKDFKTEIKQYREGFDLLGNWDKRALINSLQILSRDERNHILDIAHGRGDIIDKAISNYVKSKT